MAQLPINPIISGMMNGVAIAQQIRAMAMQQDEAARRKQQFDMDREERESMRQARDIDLTSKLLAAGRPVTGNAVLGDAVDDEMASGVPGSAAAPGLSIVRPADKKRVVKYRRADGETVAVELYPEEEQRARNRRVATADEVARTESEISRRRSLIPVGVEELDAKQNLPIMIPGFGQVAAGALPTFQRVIDARSRENIAGANILNTNEQKRLDRQSREKTAGMRAAATRAAGTGGAGGSDAQDISTAIENGDQPPTLTGLYRYGAPVRAELARRGYDLATAQRDWQAVQKHISTMNGPQQERLRQAVTFTYDSLDVIEGLFNEWEKSGKETGIPYLNKLSLAAAKELPGKPGEVARALEGQINDLVSELGTVYKGGNASTDEALRLAAENLKANWTPGQFRKSLALIRTNLKIRKNSIMQSVPVGVSPDSKFAGKPEGTAGAQKDPLGLFENKE